MNDLKRNAEKSRLSDYIVIHTSTKVTRSRYIAPEKLQYALDSFQDSARSCWGGFENRYYKIRVSTSSSQKDEIRALQLDLTVVYLERRKSVISGMWLHRELLKELVIKKEKPEELKLIFKVKYVAFGQKARTLSLPIKLLLMSNNDRS